jgi:hypothetical protein
LSRRRVQASDHACARPQRGAFRPVGIALFTAAALLLYFGLQFVRGGEHPLASSIDFDLCARLGPRPAADLPDLNATPVARIPDLSAGRASTCYWSIVEPGRATLARNIGVALMTHATLRAEGNGRGTAKYVETFIEESRASGAEVNEAKGPWKTAATIRNPGAKDLQLLAEDDGVALWLTANDVERDALVAFASAAADRLRGRETKKR